MNEVWKKKHFCHIDPISNEDLELANFYISHLGNPYMNNNLNCIMDTIPELMKK